MKRATSSAIPVSPETAAGFAALTEEEKRVVRMRLAIEIGRMSKRKSRAESAEASGRATAAIGNQPRRGGVALSKSKYMISES